MDGVGAFAECPRYQLSLNNLARVLLLVCPSTHARIGVYVPTVRLSEMDPAAFPGFQLLGISINRNPASVLLRHKGDLSLCRTVGVFLISINAKELEAWQRYRHEKYPY